MVGRLFVKALKICVRVVGNQMVLLLSIAAFHRKYAYEQSRDFSKLIGSGVGVAFESFPASISLSKREASPKLNFPQVLMATASCEEKLRSLLGGAQPLDILSMRHHDSHAAAAYALSPFSATKDHGTEPTLVVVLDGIGDEGSITVYQCDADGKLQRISAVSSLFDSLGLFYCMYPTLCCHAML